MQHAVFEVSDVLSDTFRSNRLKPEENGPDGVRSLSETHRFYGADRHLDFGKSGPNTQVIPNRKSGRAGRRLASSSSFHFDNFVPKPVVAATLATNGKRIAANTAQ